MLADEIVKDSKVSWESNTVAEILESVFERVEKGRTESKEVEYGECPQLSHSSTRDYFSYTSLPGSRCVASMQMVASQSEHCRMPAGLKGSISYKRVSLDPQRTDPFTGIFVGIFGGHGPEVLQLRRLIGEASFPQLQCHHKMPARSSQCRTDSGICAGRMARSMWRA